MMEIFSKTKDMWTWLRLPSNERIHFVEQEALILLVFIMLTPIVFVTDLIFLILQCIWYPINTCSRWLLELIERR